MNSFAPPPVPAPKDSKPGPAPVPPPGLPADADMALWDEADLRQMRGPRATFADRSDDKAGDDHAPTIGHIGRYALKHQLGEGGIGTVYAAHDPLLTRLIAVKTLHVEVVEAERESFNALFLNEARAAGGLSHPNIVTVFDAGISDDRAYIAMELLKGRDLRQLRQEGWRATPAQAALIVRRVADALGYAHDKGVVHRDIKPANIFMIARTQPKVLDFGIARIAHQQGGEQNGDIAAGSPYYMAPEQVRHEQVDRRADVFSLGVVLYELLTQLKPFRGNTLDEITAAVLAHEPPLANLVDSGVPAALAHITAKALAKDVEHRYRSARAFSRELRHWLDENSVSTEGDVQHSAPRRAKPLWLALAAVGAIVLGGAAWALLGVPRATAPAEATQPAASAAVAAAPLTELAVSTGVATEPPDASASAAADAAMTALPRAAASVADALAGAASPSAAPPTAPVNANEARTPPQGTSQETLQETLQATPKQAPKDASKDKRARETRERDARNAAATAAAAVPAPTGILRIAISPWGAVEVDGRSVGNSPPLTELRLAAGRHQIVVRNSDLPPFSTSIDITADQPVTLRHKF